MNVLKAVLVILFLGTLAAIYLIASRSEIIKINKRKNAARKAYIQGDYKNAFTHLKILKDSLAITEKEVLINLAHAGYLGSRMDSASNGLKDAFRGEPDSTKQKGINYAECIDVYRQLSSETDDRIASIALNQLGVISYTTRNTEDLAQEDLHMEESATHFRSAVDRDRSNDIARFNYELIRRKIDYPETVIKHVKELVLARRYKEARTVLKNALRQDPRVQKKYSDFVSRIETVISIDSLANS